MANLPETSAWVNEVYQIEITDPVEGGAMGVSNAQAKALANRTRYLYDILTKFMAPFVGGKGWVLFNDIAANIPTGWAEVTEMRGRAPFGHAPSGFFSSLGNTGGSTTKTLTVPNLPAHDHNVPLPSNSGGAGGTGGIAYPGANNATVNITTSSVGSGLAFDVMNPYRVVSFIKYVG